MDHGHTAVHSPPKNKESVERAFLQFGCIIADIAYNPGLDNKVNCRRVKNRNIKKTSKGRNNP